MSCLDIQVFWKRWKAYILMVWLANAIVIIAMLAAKSPGEMDAMIEAANPGFESNGIGTLFVIYGVIQLAFLAMFGLSMFGCAGYSQRPDGRREEPDFTMPRAFAGIQLGLAVFYHISFLSSSAVLLNVTYTAMLFVALNFTQYLTITYAVLLILADCLPATWVWCFGSFRESCTLCLRDLKGPCDDCECARASEGIAASMRRCYAGCWACCAPHEELRRLLVNNTAQQPAVVSPSLPPLSASASAAQAGLDAFIADRAAPNERIVASRIAAARIAFSPSIEPFPHLPIEKAAAPQVPKEPKELNTDVSVCINAASATAAPGPPAVQQADGTSAGLPSISLAVSPTASPVHAAQIQLGNLGAHEVTLP